MLELFELLLEFVELEVALLSKTEDLQDQLLETLLLLLRLLDLSPKLVHFFLQRVDALAVCLDLPLHLLVHLEELVDELGLAHSLGVRIHTLGLGGKLIRRPVELM